MIHIVTIVGARPQFIKAAVLSRLVRSRYSGGVQEYLIHTGQHYDENMSERFFKEMHIPSPDINLNIGSGNHGAMTGRMLEEIEKVLLEQKPDIVLVYGDTNSTLAGALAASKLNIPLAHIEAGLRSFKKTMPEEQNRVLTDHISTFLFCPTTVAVNNLANEGISQGVYHTGDIMFDASMYYSTLPHRLSVKVPDKFFLVTLHRAENTDSREKLASIVEALNEFKELPCVLPLHPRTRKMVIQHGLSFEDHVHIIEPVGYLDMIALEKQCSWIVTDSGGVQKEAYFFKKPCITLRDETEWVETLESGANRLTGADKQKILYALKNHDRHFDWKPLYGNGSAGDEIVSILLNNTSERLEV